MTQKPENRPFMEIRVVEGGLGERPDIQYRHMLPCGDYTDWFTAKWVNRNMLTERAKEPTQ